MAKFNLSITAHTKMNNKCSEAAWCLWSKDFNYNFMSVPCISDKCGPVLDKLLTLMPCADWVIDDGEVEKGTTYCQYVWYENNDSETGNYLLAVWTEIDEETGCMKA